jgi:hypothetical protein
MQRERQVVEEIWGRWGRRLAGKQRINALIHVMIILSGQSDVEMFRRKTKPFPQVLTSSPYDHHEQNTHI